MLLAEHVVPPVWASSECLFLPPEAGLRTPDVAESVDRDAMRDVAVEALSIMGLSGLLRPGGEHPQDVIPKPHEVVANRDPAVAEQFHHPDVATNGFCGIFLIGLEGDSVDDVPATKLVDNAAMVEHVEDFVMDTPLEHRLDDVFVVRPYYNPEDPTEWRDLPRHSLDRLASKFRGLLTEPQRNHVDAEVQSITDRSIYRGNVHLYPLCAVSEIDYTPLLTCGVAQRELRLSLRDGIQTPDETTALGQLYDEITRYLLHAETPEKAVHVVKDSAIYVPTNQLHRATPYLPQHRRSVVGVRCYAQPGVTQPESWRRASGQQY